MVLSYLAKEEWLSRGGTLHLSRLDSVVVAKSVRNVTFQSMEIRHARGAAFVVQDSTAFVINNCIVADAGMMGVNVTVGDFFEVCALALSRSKYPSSLRLLIL